jgi:prophage maintenance system killer protein
MLESAMGQPRQTFDGVDLYPSLAGKAAALGYSLIMNHPFIDGNKRIGHAALEATLMLNGHELVVASTRLMSRFSRLPRVSGLETSYRDGLRSTCTRTSGQGIHNKPLLLTAYMIRRLAERLWWVGIGSAWSSEWTWLVGRQVA